MLFTYNEIVIYNLYMKKIDIINAGIIGVAGLLSNNALAEEKKEVAAETNKVEEGLCKYGGSLRAAMQFVSTTTRSSEGSNSLAASFNTCKFTNKDFVDPMSLQFTLWTVNQNGVSPQPQINQGFTFIPGKRFNANFTGSVGADNFMTGLDSKETKKYQFAPYVQGQLTLNFLAPAGKEDSIVISPFTGVKNFLTTVKFKYDDSARKSFQPFVGLNIAKTLGSSEIGANAAYYPNDQLKKDGGVPLWGDLYYKSSF